MADRTRQALEDDRDLPSENGRAGASRGAVAKTHKRPHGARASKSEVASRVEVLVQLACSGASRRDILQFVATQTTWGVSVRTIDRYMADAHVAVVDAGRHNHELELGRAKVRLNLLFGRALAAKDYSTALAVQREINRLLNLLPAPEEASNRRGGEIPAEFTLVLGEGEVKADASVEDVPELEALTPAAALSAPALTPEVTASRDAAEDLDHAGEVL